MEQRMKLKHTLLIAIVAVMLITRVLFKNMSKDLEKQSSEPSANAEVFIAGGYGLYKEAMPFTDVMYITEVNTIIEDGDVFFPEFDENDFEVTTGETGGDEIKFNRKIYRRKK